MKKVFDLSDVHKPSCDFCGKTLREARRVVVASTGAAICDRCAEEAHRLCERKP